MERPSLARAAEYRKRIRENRPDPESVRARAVEYQESVRAYHDKLKAERNPIEQSTTNAIVNELVNSYGFARDGQTGDWTWSTDTIKKRFKESPFWASVDWLTVAFPAAKLATATRAVKAGATAYAGTRTLGQVGRKSLKGIPGTRAEGAVIGRALAEGEFAGKKASGIYGRIANMAAGPEVAAAAQAHLRGPSTGLFGKMTGGYFQSATSISKEWAKFATKYGVDNAHEQRALMKTMGLEKLIGEGAGRRMGEDAVRMWGTGKLSEAAQKAAYKGMTEGVDPSDALGLFAGMEGAEGLSRAYKATWDFRNTVHEGLYKAGYLTDEQYSAGLKKYMPRLYEEWAEFDRILQSAGKEAAAEFKKSRGMLTGGEARLMARTLTKEQAASYGTQIMDPRTHLDELTKAYALVARHNYAEQLASSSLIMDEKTIFGFLDDMIKHPEVGAAYGVSGKAAEALFGAVTQAKKLGPNAKAGQDELAKLVGYKRMEDVIGHAYHKGLPDNLKGRWVDPAVAKEITESFKFHQQTTGLVSDIARNYGKALTMFKSGKTVLNPASHIRNAMGAQFQYYIATGKVANPIAIFSRGIKSVKAKDELYVAARTAGIFGADMTHELRQALEAAGVTRALGDDGTWHVLYDGIEKLGNKMQMGGQARSVATKMRAMENLAARVYRGTDDLIKLDVFRVYREKLMKKGMSKADANLAAAAETLRWTPQYGAQSAAGDVLRSAIPFASFTTESLRIYKNALHEVPHRVFAVNHVTEVASQMFGAIAGMDPAEIEKAKGNLPEYMQGKKSILFPLLGTDGQPHFIDLSYVMPLANMGDAKAADSLFFEELYDIGSNPVIGFGAAITTGVDAFTGKKIEPSFTEEQLGIPVDNQRVRRAVGLLEYTARTFLPPLAPNGPGGKNLLEMVRGTVSPQTGQKLEPDPWRTIFANIFAMRTYSPNVESQVLNIRHEQRALDEYTTQAWKRYDFARAQMDIKAMVDEKQRILVQRAARGDDDPMEYFRKAAAKRKQIFGNLSRQNLEDILQRSRGMPLSREQKEMQAELMHRYHGGRK